MAELGRSKAMTGEDVLDGNRAAEWERVDESSRNKGTSRPLEGEGGFEGLDGVGVGGEVPLNGIKAMSTEAEERKSWWRGRRRARGPLALFRGLLCGGRVVE